MIPCREMPMRLQDFMSTEPTDRVTQLTATEVRYLQMPHKICSPMRT